MSFDEAYAPYAAVAALSAMVHTSGPVQFHFLVGNLDDASLDLVCSTVTGLRGEYAIYRVDDGRFADLAFGQLGYLSPATYYRTTLPEQVRVERCIYLDCDTIVTCDLRPLMELDLQGAAFGGCIDPHASKTSPMAHFITDGLYFNTGIALLDLSAMRSMNFERSFKNAYDLYSAHIRYADQCILNKVLDGRKRLIDSRWNVQVTMYQDLALQPIMESMDRSAIFHGCGSVKPWMTWSDPWLHDLWKRYARLLNAPLSSLVVEPRTSGELMLKIQKLEKFGKWQEAATEKGKLITFLDHRLKQSVTA